VKNQASSVVVCSLVERSRFQVIDVVLSFDPTKLCIIVLSKKACLLGLYCMTGLCLGPF
jgi:hypothetical protein